jgi:alpha-1,2-mannosyltransferase
VVWLWWAGVYGWTGTLGSNTYVWISAGLLPAVPVARRVAPPAERRSDRTTAPA